MVTDDVAREVHLRHRPDGPVGVDDLGVQTRHLGPLPPGGFVVRNTWLSIDASTLLRLDGTGGDYLAPVVPGTPLDGWAVGRVERSESARFQVGQSVLHQQGWRDRAVLSDAVRGWGAPEVLAIDELRTEQLYLGPLGPTGLTAWAGLLKVAELRADDVVFVSAAAGSVGSLVVQLAKHRGCSVVASAGSTEKARLVRETFGADASFSYRDGPVEHQLRALVPEGIDVYFDNVGGDHLEAALEVLRPGGRVALCGAISGYGSGAAPIGPRNLFNATIKGLTLRGFLARTYAGDLEEAREHFRRMLAAGALAFPLCVTEGLDQAPAALMDLLHGRSTGKVLVGLERDGTPAQPGSTRSPPTPTSRAGPSLLPADGVPALGTPRVVPPDPPTAPREE